MEVVGHDRRKVIWGFVGNHVVEEETHHDEIGLQGFNYNLFDEYYKRVGREGSSWFPYLLRLVKLCNSYLKTQLKMINLKVDEKNGKAMGI